MAPNLLRFSVRQAASLSSVFVLDIVNRPTSVSCQLVELFVLDISDQPSTDKLAARRTLTARSWQLVRTLAATSWQLVRTLAATSWQLVGPWPRPEGRLADNTRSASNSNAILASLEPILPLLDYSGRISQYGQTPCHHAPRDHNFRVPRTAPCERAGHLLDSPSNS